MDIERLRQAAIDKRFILSANPDWRAGRSCGLSGDETEQKANNALTIILENLEELVVAYLIDSHQSVKSEEVQEAIDILQAIRPSEKETTGCHYCIGIESHGIVAVKTVIDEYLRVIPAYDTPYNYCPNCGRKIKEQTDGTERKERV